MKIAYFGNGLERIYQILKDRGHEIVFVSYADLPTDKEWARRGFFGKLRLFIKENLIVLAPKLCIGPWFSDYIKTKLLCLEHKIPCCSYREINSVNTFVALQTSKPDLIICNGIPRKVAPYILEQAKHSINIHAGKLPQYAGMYPIAKAIANGEDQICLTAHEMTDEIDGGKVVAERYYDRKDLNWADEVLNGHFSLILFIIDCFT